MSMIPKHFKNAVLAIGEVLPNGPSKWIASGFIVGKKRANAPQLTDIYLITNNIFYIRKDHLFRTTFSTHSNLPYHRAPSPFYLDSLYSRNRIPP